MRTEENWEQNFEEKKSQIFPPRIQQDLKTFGTDKPVIGTEGSVDSMFIYGKIKTGKTILAAQMGMEEMKRIYLHNIPIEGEIIFVSFPEMLAEIKSTFNNPNKRESEVMDKYINAHLLILDDFLTSRPTEWVMDVLYYLINHRYEYLKKTIITSNLSLPELEEKLQDQRIISRIDRMCVLVNI